MAVWQVASVQMVRTQFAAGRSHSERLTPYVLSRLPTEFQAWQIATSKPSSLAAAQLALRPLAALIAPGSNA